MIWGKDILKSLNTSDAHNNTYKFRKPDIYTFCIWLAAIMFYQEYIWVDFLGVQPTCLLEWCDRLSKICSGR